MAYGKNCPVCGAIVDSNEYDYLHDMCIECAEEQERIEERNTVAAKMMNADCEQMRLEDLCVLK